MDTHDAVNSRAKSRRNLAAPCAAVTWTNDSPPAQAARPLADEACRTLGRASQRDLERGARRARCTSDIAAEDRARPRRSHHGALRRVPTKHGATPAALSPVLGMR